MPSHSTTPLLEQIEQTQELADRLNALTANLQQGLDQQFANQFGFPVPNALKAEVTESDWLVTYADSFSADEMIKGATDLMSAAFSGDDGAALVLAGAKVVGTLIDQAFGGGAIADGLKSSSAKVSGPDGERYLVACLANTQKCSHEQWFTQQDFYASYYILVVVDPKAVDMPAEQLDAVPAV